MTEVLKPIITEVVPAEMSKQLDSVLPEYKEKATYCITACCQATQAAKNAIGNFGEVSTDLSSSEKVVNMLYYILGEEVLSEVNHLNSVWDNYLTDKDINKIIKELKALTK